MTDKSQISDRKVANKMLILTNGSSKATIDPIRGATVCQLYLNSQSIFLPVESSLPTTEWPAGGMPICFPFAGRVWHDRMEGRYLAGTGRDAVNNQSSSQNIQPMPIHGFGSRLAWQVTHSDKAQATLRLTDSEATRDIYPWRFEADVTYQLGTDNLKVQASIKCTEVLHAAGGRPMPLAPGLHPYFAAQHPSENMAGSISFAYDHCTVPALESIDVTKEGNAGAKRLLSDKAADISGGSLPAPGKYRLPLHSEFLHNRIFTGLLENTMTLGPLELSWSKSAPWKYLVFWAKPQSHFLCVEPWVGLPDAPHRAGQDGGAIQLSEQQSMNFDFAIKLPAGEVCNEPDHLHQETKEQT